MVPESAVQAGRSPEAGAAPGPLEAVRLFVNTRDIELGTDELSTPEALTNWLAGHGLLPPAGADLDPGQVPQAAATMADLRRAVELREALRGVLASHVNPGRHYPDAAAAGGGVRRAAPGRSSAGADHAAPGRSSPGGGRAAPGRSSAGADRAVRAGPVAGPVSDLRRIAGSLRTRLDISDDGQVAATPAGPGPAAGLAAILLIAAESAATGTWSRLKVCSADDCRWAFYDRSPTRNACWCSMAVCGARAKSRAYRRRAAARR